MDIDTFVSKFDTCQCNKGELIWTLGQLQPLLIPSSLWTNISMEFNMGLPKVGNKSFLMVIANCLSNYTHFCAFPHPFTLALASLIFIDQIYKLHGMPTSIVSYRDPTFTSHFWQDLFKL